MAACESGHAKVLFDGRHLSVDGGTGDEQFGGRIGDAQVARGGLEPAQQVEGRQASALFLHSLNSCELFSNVV